MLTSMLVTSYNFSRRSVQMFLAAMNTVITVNTLPTCVHRYSMTSALRTCLVHRGGVTGANYGKESLAHEAEEPAVSFGFASSIRSSVIGQSWEKKCVCTTEAHHIALQLLQSPPLQLPFPTAGREMCHLRSHCIGIFSLDMAAVPKGVTY